MKRREFITLFGGAAATWPLAARAQQPNKVRHIGVLMPNDKSDPEARAWIAAFEEGLQSLGWGQDRNIRIDYRWTGADQQRLRAAAAELVGMAPDALFAAGGALASRGQEQS